MNKQTTRMMLMIAALVRLPALAAEPPPPAPPALVKPTPEQVAWQDLELGMFYHFDIITFTDLNEGAWQGAGHLDPNLYNPVKGQCVGHKRIEQFGDVAVSKVRLRVTKSTAKPLLRTLAVYHVTPRPTAAQQPPAWIPEPMMQTRACSPPPTESGSLFAGFANTLVFAHPL